MSYNVTAFSLRVGNALKKVRGFKPVEGTNIWSKTARNWANETIEYSIFPSGTNVLIKTTGDETRKKVIKPDGTIYKSVLGGGRWVETLKRMPYRISKELFYNRNQQRGSAINPIRLFVLRDDVKF